jgi:AcrR family transcriptional regulator
MIDSRTRILEAAYECIGRYGISKTTVEDVARAAGVSRATVYRYFPGGREQVVRDVISWEAGRFFERLAAAVSGAQDLAELVSEALLFAHRSIASHQVLQKVLDTEPELLLPQLTIENTRLLAFIRAFLSGWVARAPLRAGITPDEATDLLSRLILSYIGAPGGWDLTDPAAVRRLVAVEMIATVCEPSS